MKIALISDIHGNAVALDSVLANIARQNVDQIICLGDIITLGPQPRQVFDRLQTLNCQCVMGNHDEEYLRPELIPPANTWLGRVFAWCAAQLTDADRAYLATFRSTIEIPLEGGQTLLCCHATPRDNQEMLLATTPDESLEAMLAGHWAHNVIAFGHTHTQLLRLYHHNLLVGVGSVGFPIARPWSERGELVRTYPWSEYTLIHSHDKQIRVEFCRLPMDMTATIAAAQASGMPDLDAWLEMWIKEY